MPLHLLWLVATPCLNLGAQTPLCQSLLGCCFSSGSLYALQLTIGMSRAGAHCLDQVFIDPVGLLAGLAQEIFEVTRDDGAGYVSPLQCVNPGLLSESGHRFSSLLCQWFFCFDDAISGTAIIFVLPAAHQGFFNDRVGRGRARWPGFGPVLGHRVFLGGWLPWCAVLAEPRLCFGFVLAEPLLCFGHQKLQGFLLCWLCKAAFSVFLWSWLVLVVAAGLCPTFAWGTTKVLGRNCRACWVVWDRCKC